MKQEKESKKNIAKLIYKSINDFAIKNNYSKNDMCDLLKVQSYVYVFHMNNMKAGIDCDIKFLLSILENAPRSLSEIILEKELVGNGEVKSN